MFYMCHFVSHLELCYMYYFSFFGKLYFGKLYFDHLTLVFETLSSSNLMISSCTFETFKLCMGKKIFKLYDLTLVFFAVPTFFLYFIKLFFAKTSFDDVYILWKKYFRFSKSYTININFYTIKIRL